MHCGSSISLVAIFYMMSFYIGCALKLGHDRSSCVHFCKKMRQVELCFDVYSIVGYIDFWGRVCSPSLLLI